MSISSWIDRNFTRTADVTASVAVEPPALPPVDTVLVAYEALLALREGRRNDVYLDTKDKLTVGIGHLVLPQDGLAYKQRITDAQVDAFFAVDSHASMVAARDQAEQAGITDTEFLPYLASVCFQMGNRWTAKFPRTWQMICDGQYERAALAFNGTPWQEQTPSRVEDFQAALRRLPAKA